VGGRIRDAARSRNGNGLPAALGLPRSWDEIGPGHLVIAQESLQYGWWEAIVLARKGDTFILQYRDYPHLPKFVRHRSGIVSLIPKCAGQQRQDGHVKMIAASLSQPRAPTRLSTIRTTKDRANPLQPPVRDAMLAAVPSLRAFAIALCGKVDLRTTLCRKRSCAP